MFTKPTEIRYYPRDDRTAEKLAELVIEAYDLGALQMPGSESFTSYELLNGEEDAGNASAPTYRPLNREEIERELSSNCRGGLALFGPPIDDLDGPFVDLHGSINGLEFNLHEVSVDLLRQGEVVPRANKNQLMEVTFKLLAIAVKYLPTSISRFLASGRKWFHNSGHFEFQIGDSLQMADKFYKDEHASNFPYFGDVLGYTNNNHYILDYYGTRTLVDKWTAEHCYRKKKRLRQIMIKDFPISPVNVDTE